MIALLTRVLQPSLARSRRLAGALVAASLVTVGLTACERPATQQGSSADSELIQISVGVDAGYAPFYLADHEGMFADAGLNVELVQTEGGAAGAQNVAAEITQFSGNADSTALTVMADQRELRGLMVFEESDRYFKVVVRDGVEPEKIKKVAVFPGIGEYFTDRYLEDLGLDPDSVEHVTTSPPEQPALLARGDVDAYVSFDPWVEQGVRQGGRIVATTADFGMSYTQWLVTTETFAVEHEEETVAVGKVLSEASKRVQDDPDAAAEATAQAIQMDPGQAKDLIGQIDFGSRDFTDQDVARFQDMVSYFSEQGIIKEQYDPGDVLARGWYTEKIE